MIAALERTTAIRRDYWSSWDKGTGNGHGGGDRPRPASREQTAQGPAQLRRLLLSLPDALRAGSRRALLDLSSQQCRRPDAAAPTRPPPAPGAGRDSGTRCLSRARIGGYDRPDG